jgi:hypothetical protein
MMKKPITPPGQPDDHFLGKQLTKDGNDLEDFDNTDCRTQGEENE